jgi:1-deoxyxylulose-5-phosphate synthase
MPGTRLTHHTAGARYRDRYWRERELETVEALRPLATEAGMSMTQMAVAWVLENPIVTAPIVGASRPEQLDDALAAVDKGLDAGLKTRLNDLTREYRWGDDIR